MAYVFLAAAIIFEVAGTVSLRLAVDNKRWYGGVTVGYLVAFMMLTLTLANGLPLGVSYGIWAAAGVALTAIISKFLFNEPLTWLMGLGMLLVMGGVLLVELGATH
ncbi:DMT family transporter [Arthrobacter sp. MPF02]|uniref:DMT family transporter n=1 Tax=Arthrobacter sp. MPF02 TaxID=3388492 RepID=UPI003984D455